MDYEQSFLANIKSEHETNGDRRFIIGAYLNSFEFTYNALASSSTSFKGNLYFEGDNEARPITFCKLDHRGEEEAKNIFNLTSFISDHRIVRPWFAKLIKQKDILRARGRERRRGRISNFDNVESFWTIAYDHFDFVLHDGLDKLDRVKDPIHDEDALLWWRSEIKALLCTIRNMHRKKLMHGKLKDMKSYVVVGDEQKMKIINIENKLTHDKEKLQDLKDFKVMLRDLSCCIIGEEANNWNDLTLFLNFFDKGSGYNKYDIFVDQLIEHPFLKTPTERIKLYASFHQKILTRTLRRFREFKQSKSFGGYLPWNTKKMAGWMTDIYDHKHAIKYDGNRPEDLIRFVKNIKNHYAKKGVPIEVVDAEVRRLYSEFFNEVHVFS